MRTWGAQMNIIVAIEDERDEPHARNFLNGLCDLARFPDSVGRMVMTKSFSDAVVEAPPADLNILGLRREPDFDWVLDTVKRTRTSSLLVLDSGRESALS